MVTPAPVPSPPSPGGSDRLEAQSVLKARLLSRCSPSPQPTSGDLAPDQIAAAAQLFASTLLQHWSLYRVLFSRPQQHTLHKEHLMVGEETWHGE